MQGLDMSWFTVRDTALPQARRSNRACRSMEYPGEIRLGGAAGCGGRMKHVLGGMARPPLSRPVAQLSSGLQPPL